MGSFMARRLKARLLTQLNGSFAVVVSGCGGGEDGRPSSMPRWPSAYCQLVGPPHFSQNRCNDPASRLLTSQSRRAAKLSAPQSPHFSSAPDSFAAALSGEEN